MRPIVLVVLASGFVACSETGISAKNDWDTPATDAGGTTWGAIETTPAAPGVGQVPYEGDPADLDGTDGTDGTDGAGTPADPVDPPSDPVVVDTGVAPDFVPADTGAVVVEADPVVPDTGAVLDEPEPLTPNHGVLVHADPCGSIAAAIPVLDGLQVPGDGRVTYCHSGSGWNWSLLDTAVAACSAHEAHGWDVFPSGGCVD